MAIILVRDLDEAKLSKNLLLLGALSWAKIGVDCLRFETR